MGTVLPPSLMLPESLELRAIAEADLPYLRMLYQQSRAQELSVTPWTAEQIENFLCQQFELQHAHYQANYPGAHWQIIRSHGKDCGRFYWQRTAHALSVIDIIVESSAQRTGIARALFEALFDQAKQCALPVELYVERNNPILAFYQRIGFQLIGEHGPYLQMRTNPL